MIQRTLDPRNEPFATQPSALKVQGFSSLEDSQWKNMAPGALLAAVDAAAILAAIAVASIIAGTVEAPVGTLLAGPLAWASAIPVLIAALALSGVYLASVRTSLAGVSVRAVAVLSFAGMAFGTAGLLAPYPPEIVTHTFMVWAAALVLIPVGRITASPLLQVMHRRGIGRRPVIVVGTHPEVAATARALEARGGAYRLAGVIELSDRAVQRRNGGPDGASPGESDGDSDLAGVLDRINGRHEFLLAASPAYLRQVETAVRPFLPDKAPVYLDLSVLLGGPETGGVGVIGNGMPAVRLRPRHDCWRYAVAKRALDLVVATTALIVAAPLMLLIALAIKLDSPGPALFRQSRVGRYGQIFSMYKFRSMRPDAEAIQAELLAANEAKGPMFKIKHDPRITRVGRVIRRLSLDELPQLFNVLQGTMSVVGPRPPLPREVMEYEPWQLRRLELTPGITGLWQVSRIDTSSFDEMVQMDLQYNDGWSLLMDIRILVKTLPAMIMARGAY